MLGQDPPVEVCMSPTVSAPVEVSGTAPVVLASPPVPLEIGSPDVVTLSVVVTAPVVPAGAPVSEAPSVPVPDPVVPVPTGSAAEGHAAHKLRLTRGIG